MIYSLNNNLSKIETSLKDVPLEVTSNWNSPIEKCDYYYYVGDNSEFWTIGFLKVDDCHCAIDFKSTLKGGLKAIKFFISVVNYYESVYAIPNDTGAYIWSSLQFKHESLYLTVSWRPNARNYCHKSHKYLFLNHFFKLTTESGLFRLNRKVYYTGSLPKTLHLDTF